jgi:phage-related baseplate assembly protein
MAQNKKDIRYLNKDFSQYRANLIEFAKNYFPNTYNDFNESSPGMMFIEMASYVGDVLSYYTDNQLKESLLDYASNKPNVLALASNVGYKVKNTIPASVDLDVFQLLPAKSSANGKIPDWTYALTLKENMVVRSETTNTEFRTLNLINFAASSSFDPTDVSVYQVSDVDNTPEYYLLKKSVKALSGTIQTKTFEFENAKRFDKILINDTDIIEVLSVTDSDNNLWTEVPFLAQDMVFESIANTVQNDPELSAYVDVPYLLKLKKTARRFITKFRSDKNLEIQFGSGISDNDDEEIIPNPDNVGSSLNGLQIQFDHPIDPSNFMYTKSYGLAPSNTTLTVRYTVGGGVQSNAAAYTLKNIADVIYQIDSQALDATLLNRIKASVACTNPFPAAGGKSEETIDEIRQNAMASFASQQRAVTTQDYIIRAYSMPSRFGSVAKAYVIQDQQINPDNGQEMIPNPLAINLYTLGYDGNGALAPLNAAVKENLKTYINNYRILTDAVNIKTAYIINIGVKFEIITLPEYNSNEVLIKCIDKIKTIFNNKLWQINQPIVISKLYTELDRVEGVQSVTSVQIANLFDTNSGYSGNVYDISAATKAGVIYPSLDPSIFEIKYPNKDIIGKVVSL